MRLYNSLIFLFCLFQAHFFIYSFFLFSWKFHRFQVLHCSVMSICLTWTLQSLQFSLLSFDLTILSDLHKAMVFAVSTNNNLESLRLNFYIPSDSFSSPTDTSSSSSKFSKPASLFEISTWYCSLNTTSSFFGINSLHIKVLHRLFTKK